MSELGFRFLSFGLLPALQAALGKQGRNWRVRVHFTKQAAEHGWAIQSWPVTSKGENGLPGREQPEHPGRVTVNGTPMDWPVACWAKRQGCKWACLVQGLACSLRSLGFVLGLPGAGKGLLYVLELPESSHGFSGLLGPPSSCIVPMPSHQDREGAKLPEIALRFSQIYSWFGVFLLFKSPPTLPTSKCPIQASGPTKSWSGPGWAMYWTVSTLPFLDNFRFP